MSGWWNSFVHLPWRRQALGVFLASLAVRGVYLLMIGQWAAPPPNYNEQVRMANYLLHGSGYVSPVGPERDDPSSWYAPGYVGLLTALFWVFGEGTTTSWVAARLMNLLLLSAGLVLWTMLARYYLGRRVAALSAALLVFSPALTAKAHDIWDTYPNLLVGAACLSLFSFRPPQTMRSSALAGAACGVGALINPNFTLCYPLWVLWGRWSLRTQRGWKVPLWRDGAHVAATVLGFVLVILPWTLRNHAVFGEWFYLRGNLPFELWSGNAPWNNGYGVPDHGKRLRHPVFDPEEAVRLTAVGEYAYFKQCRQEVGEWVRNDPRTFVERSAARVGWFWFGRVAHDKSAVQSVVKVLGYTVPGALALLGCVYVLVRRPGAQVLVWTLMIFPVMYYVCLMMARYRVPVEPLVLIMAATAAVAAGRMRRRSA